MPQQSLAANAAPPSRLIESVDPATGTVMERLEAANPTDLPAVFERARNAQKEWAARPLRDRCNILQRLRDVIFDSLDEIADTITRETGKPRVEATFAEILLALDTANFLARRASRWLRPENPSGRKLSRSESQRHAGSCLRAGSGIQLHKLQTLPEKQAA